MPHTKEIHNDVYCSSQFCIYWGTYLVIYNYCLCLCIWRPNVSWYFELSWSCSLNIDFSILRQRWYRGSIIERTGGLGFNSSSTARANRWNMELSAVWWSIVRVCSVHHALEVRLAVQNWILTTLHQIVWQSFKVVAAVPSSAGKGGRQRDPLWIGTNYSGEGEVRWEC